MLLITGIRMTMDEAALLADGTIQFSNGSAPGLPTGRYTITVEHTLDAAGAPPMSASQTVLVQGPQFALNPQFISSSYPPDDGADVYDQELPFVAFADPHLPWELSLDLFGAGGSPPAPWLALLLFAEGEIAVDPSTSSPLTTITVAQLLAASSPGSTTLGPDIAPDTLAPGVPGTQCQVITVTAEAFAAVLPSTDDLVYLAHRRSLDVSGEPQQTVSTLLCNRLAVSSTTSAPSSPAGVRYYAHVVSLQGLTQYLDGQLPAGCTQVQMVSLYSWSFLSMPQTGANFTTLAQGLVDSQGATGGALALPLPSTSPAGVPAEVVERLDAGYVALGFHAFDTQTFAWYRGPFSAVDPAPLPPVGSPPVPVENATASDALLVYLTDQGVFDAGYAAAWNLGRGMALANGSYTAALLAYRQQGAAALTLLAERMAHPRYAGMEPRALLARDAARRRFRELLNEGLGRRWTGALEDPRPGPGAGETRWAGAAAPPLSRTGLLRRADVVEAVAGTVDEPAQAAAQFLGGLCLLQGVPFSALVPDPRMLPVESIRFFYVDRDWIAALVAGAASLAVGSSVELALHQALWPSLRAAVEAARRRRFARFAAGFSTPGASPGLAVTGVLVRSQLVSSFPTLNVTAQAGGGELDVVRDDVLSPSVRMCLFDGVPDTVTLAEPYHGLRFGTEPAGVAPRALSGSVGQPLGITFPLASSGLCGADGVLQVSGLAAALGGAGYLDTPVDPGGLALQLVQVPLAQSFSFPG